MATVPKEFICRFFSNDSSEKYDNTMSSFTTELETSIDLGSVEYEVGVCQLALNPCLKSEHIKRDTRDVIQLNYEAKNLTLEDFVKHMMSHVISPEMYDSAYFSNYMDKNFFFDEISLGKHFDHDNYTVDVEKDGPTAIKVNVDMSLLLKAGEKFGDFFPHHLEKTEELKTLNLYAFTRTPLRMLQILNTLVRYVLFHLRKTGKNGDSSIALHNTMFFGAISLYQHFDEMQQYRRLHLNRINEFCHRFVAYFTNLVQLEIKKMKIETIPRTERFIFIYCDLIHSQWVGPTKSRLLHVMPLGIQRTADFFDQTVQNIQFSKVEKTSFKSVSFLLLNEYGEKLDFTPSYVSNFIALKFQRV